MDKLLLIIFAIFFLHHSSSAEIRSLKNNKVNDYIKLIPYEEWDSTCIRTFVLAS